MLGIALIFIVKKFYKFFLKKFGYEVIEQNQNKEIKDIQYRHLEDTIQTYIDNNHIEENNSGMKAIAMIVVVVLIIVFLQMLSLSK